MSDSNLEPSVDTGAVDTHCHLFLLDRQPELVVETATAAGVTRLICPGVDVATSRESLEIAQRIETVFATAGMHPHDASTWDPQARRDVAALLQEDRVIAVGECGLDFFRMHSPRADQERCLRDHVALSRETGKPMVVHIRDAWPETLKLLDEEKAEKVVIHCFSGDVDLALECQARGYWISFAANITYPKNAQFREAAAAVSADRLLSETDSPYLAPQRIRGKDNSPENVLESIATIAEARGESVAEITRVTAANARAAFPGLR